MEGLHSGWLLKKLRNVFGVGFFNCTYESYIQFIKGRKWVPLPETWALRRKNTPEKNGTVSICNKDNKLFVKSTDTINHHWTAQACKCIITAWILITKWPWICIAWRCLACIPIHCVRQCCNHPALYRLVMVWISPGKLLEVVYPRPRPLSHPAWITAWTAACHTTLLTLAVLPLPP